MRFLIAVMLVGGVVAHLGAAVDQGPFDDRASSVQFAGTMFVESWDKNGSTDILGGGTMTLARPFRKQWMAMVEATFLRVAEDGLPDPYLSGFSILFRRRLFDAAAASVFAEWGPGISFATRPVPAGGTRVNYLVQAGLGTLIRMAPGAYLVAGARYLHLSNNSLAGRGRNPDIQALGGYLGTLLVF